jgi:hypothetical protein
MAVGSKLQRALEEILEPGETVVSSTFAELKQGGGATRLAKDFGVSLVASAAISATGFGVMRHTMPALVWLVATDKRLLMLERPDGRNSIGELVFNVPLNALTLKDTSGLRGEIVVDDSATGDNLVRLNFGLRKGAAREIAAAAHA